MLFSKKEAWTLRQTEAAEAATHAGAPTEFCCTQLSQWRCYCTVCTRFPCLCYCTCARACNPATESTGGAPLGQCQRVPVTKVPFSLLSPALPALGPTLPTSPTQYECALLTEQRGVPCCPPHEQAPLAPALTHPTDGLQALSGQCSLLHGPAG